MAELEIKFLDEPTFNSHLAKLISANGELEKTDLSLQDIRNMIYTRRVKINPDVEGAVDRAKSPKTPSVNRKKVDGFGVDDILG